MTQETDSGRKPRRRFGTAVLIASLGLNAVFGGYLATQFWRRYEMSAAGSTPRGMLRLVRWRLPAADKAVLDAAVQKKEGEIAAAQAEYQKALSAAFASLRKPDFNEAEFRAAVAAAREKRLRLADLGLDVFVDAAARVSPEGRSALVPKRMR